jgi:hypothetical protein
LGLVWLAVPFWNITIAKENEANVKEIRDLLDMSGEDEPYSL